MLWISGGYEQPPEDLEDTTSMYAAPLQLTKNAMPSNAMPNTRELVVVAAGKKGGKVNTGLSSVDDTVVRNNLEGLSRFMGKKGWVDPRGRKGKGFGVYRFANKYGTNIDGYSPIYRPGEWSESGGEFTLGTKGLLAWAALVVVLLGVGINAVIATSSL